MRSPFLARRDVLKTLTIGAGVMPVAASFGRAFLPRAHAALGGGIRRILFIDLPNGVPENAGGYDDFAVKGATPTDFKLGVLTQPLETLGLKQDLVILDHMEMRNGERNAVNTHACGFQQMLTGYLPGESERKARGISVDQLLANKIGRMVTPKFPSLTLSVQTDGASHSYLADGTQVPPNQDPYDAYKKVFAGLMTGGGGAAMPDPVLIGRLKRKLSVLDHAAKEIVALKPKLSPEDRARADAQLDSIRTMETRLSASLETPPGPKATCTTPTQQAGLNVRSDRVFPELCRMQLDIVVNAFACDLTRIVTLGFRNADYQVYQCNFAPVNVADQNLHGLSHNNPKDAFAAFKRAKALLFTIVGEAAKKLKSIPEGSGSMLDNTLIFCGTEIGRGHTMGGHQYLTIGGKNLGVQTGRWIAPSGTNREPWSGVPHQRLLVSFLNAMGLPDQTFGEGPNTGSGPLPGYLA